jgi:hypothetical protein
MFWFIVFLLGALCAMIGVVALAVWLGITAIQALLECVEKSLTNLGNGHAIAGALYLFVSAIAQFVCLAFSFWQEVLR